MDTQRIFGNVIPPRALRSARANFEKLARKFSYDPDWRPSYEARPMDKGFEALGIRVLSEREGSPAAGGLFGDPSLDPKKAMILGTIRMGYGHYRIAIALASAAKAMGYDPYWLDFLAFPGSAASRTIIYLEELYAMASRLSQKYRLFNRLVWDKVTSEIPLKIPYAARDRELSRLFVPLCSTLPKDLPFVATHPWTSRAAVQAGIEDVVTAVPDNYPLAFHLVEGSLHAVQTPSAYTGYRALRDMAPKGEPDLVPMPESDIRFAGHFVDHEIVQGIDEDCDLRLSRLRDRGARRILLTIGGAGAQVRRFREIIRASRQAVAEGRVVLFVNMGDHRLRWAELKAELDGDATPYVLHDEWGASSAFAEEARRDRGLKGLHVFLHGDTFSAVYMTNLLMRASDVMVTKPSELSFYPVPKLFIQRVGRHEAWGAIRGAEIGDGTLETASAGGVLQMLKLIVESEDLLRLYCGRIVRNKAAGIYDGAYNVIEYAAERKPRL